MTCAIMWLRLKPSLPVKHKGVRQTFVLIVRIFRTLSHKNEGKDAQCSQRNVYYIGHKNVIMYLFSYLSRAEGEFLVPSTYAASDRRSRRSFANLRDLKNTSMIGRVKTNWHWLHDTLNRNKLEQMQFYLQQLLLYKAEFCGAFRTVLSWRLI